MDVLQIQNKKKWCELNLQIRSQLIANKVMDYKGNIITKITHMPDSEWKTWICELMKIRDNLTTLI